MRNSLLWGALVVLVTAGCGKDKATTGGKVSLNVLANSTSTNLAALSVPLLPDAISPFGVASNSSSELQSLKYIFGFMSICESLTINGSAFNNPTNCIQIYTGPTIGDGSSGSVTPSTLSTYASSQIDMMDATSRANLNASVTLTSDHVRSYNYAVINWYTPIAVKGCVTVGASLICSKNGGASYASSVTTTTDAFASSATSEAEEAIVVSSNGGSFFKFQQPFVISSDDISSGTNFTVDMVFNPSAVLAGDSTQATAGNLRGTDASLYVPMLNIAPVPRKGTQTTKRETYLTSGNCPSTRAKYRIELYYNSDSSSSVLGATGTYVADSSASGSFSIMQADLGGKVVSIETATDGSLTLNTSSSSGSSGLAWISGLSRGTSGTLTMHDDSFGGSATTCAYTYVGTATVE